MRRFYEYRLRPTARRHVALATRVESHRELYNAALQERRDAWMHSKTRVCYGNQSAQLSEIRSARPDQAIWSFSSQRATLRRLNRAAMSSQGRADPDFRGQGLMNRTPLGDLE
jgi:putative transposase